jgi:hypothetical protein
MEHESTLEWCGGQTLGETSELQGFKAKEHPSGPNNSSSIVIVPRSSVPIAYKHDFCISIPQRQKHIGWRTGDCKMRL